MVARISQGRVQLADTRAAAQYLKEVYLCNAEQQEGFRGMVGFFNEDGHIVVAEMYDIVEQIRATEKRGWYQSMVELFGTEHIKGQVRRSFYEVAVSSGLKGAD